MSSRVITLLLAIIANCIVITSVLAQGLISDVVKGTLNATGEIIDASGRVVGHLTVGAPDKKVKATTTVSTVTMPVVLTDILTTRRLFLERQLEQSKGLTAEQIADFRAQIDRIIAADAQAKLRAAITFEEALALAKDLDEVSGKVASVTQTKITPLIVVDPASGVQRIAVTETVFQRIQ